MAEGTLLPVPVEVTETRTTIQQMFVKYEVFKVKDQASFDEAGEALKLTSKLEKQIGDQRKNLTRPLDDLKKKWMEFFAGPENACTRLKCLLQNKMMDYRNEQERIRREQEARIQEANRREADKLNRRAMKAEESGKMEKADMLKEQAANVAMLQPVVSSQVQKVEGTRIVKNWTYEIEQEELIPREFCSPDSKKIRAMVIAHKENAKIPGVRVFFTETVSTTGR